MKDGPLPDLKARSSFPLRVSLAIALLLLPVPAWSQADYARERRWAEEVTPALVVGDPVDLVLESGRKFLAIYAPAPKTAGGVIVVHGLGVHPDWGLIGTLRSRLPEHGYATLSVQMPVLAAGAPGEEYPPLFPEAAERLAAAVAWLRGKGVGKMAIVSHSMGARMANHFLARAADPGVAAWVAIGIPGLVVGTAKVPALDLYGEKDYPAVLGNAPKRAEVLRAIRGSAQAEVAGADHFFAGREDELVRQVRLFLDRHLR
jgi:pimeloyl-ACP methyl ester carboxylesterase